MNVRNIALALALLGLAACESSHKKVCNINNVDECCATGEVCDFVNNAGDRAFFEFDSSNLTEEAKATLDKQICWLKKYDCKKVLVEGHCDERGTREYNLGLGERRAQAVAAYLTCNGIDACRVRTVSYGKDRPIILAENTPKTEIWKANRVSISVIE